MNKIILNILAISVRDISHELNALSVFARALVLLMLASALLLPGCAGQENEVMFETSQMEIAKKLNPTKIITERVASQSIQERGYIWIGRLIEINETLTIDENDDIYKINWDEFTYVSGLVINKRKSECEYILSLPIMTQIKRLTINCVGEEPLVIGAKTLNKCVSLIYLLIYNAKINSISSFDKIPYLRFLEYKTLISVVI